MLLNNLDYLSNTLDVVDIEVKYTDDPEAPEKTREEVRPGSPFIAFIIAPNVAVELVNPIERSGLFQVNTVICEGETVQQLTEKLAKMINFKADLSTLKLWRYNDPLLGPRQIPEFQNYQQNKTPLTDGAYILSVETKQVSLKVEDKVIEVGTNFIYVVD